MNKILPKLIIYLINIGHVILLLANKYKCFLLIEMFYDAFVDTPKGGHVGSHNLGKPLDF
jgi:hypothetical protein